MTRFLGAIAAAALLSIAAAANSGPGPAVHAVHSQAALVPAPCPTGEWAPEDVPVSSRADARGYNGAYSGGVYKIEIPEKWNGELVLWAHGLVGAEGPNGRRLRAPDIPIRDHLIPAGFAWASSSYRCNGYVAGAGMLDTLALIDLFVKTNGGKAPQRVYLVGASMGGHATLLAMHHAADRLNGALPVCHASSELFGFFEEAGRTAARLARVTPAGDTLQSDMKAIAAALGAPPNYTDAGRESARQQIDSSGGPRPFVADSLAASNRFLANLQIGVPMIVAPARPDHFDQQPFTGRITRPVLTLHTTGDMLVPIHLQRTLRQAVTKAGRDSLLVQRIIRAPGHCTFTPQEMTAAFDDLVAWVRTGKRPEGDDVMADFRDAGRRFTNPLRDGDPGQLTVK